jgi:hypothetical protein
MHLPLLYLIGARVGYLYHFSLNPTLRNSRWLFIYTRFWARRKLNFLVRLASSGHPASTFGTGLLIAWSAYYMGCTIPAVGTHTGSTGSCSESAHPSFTPTPATSTTSASATARHIEQAVICARNAA